MYSKLRRPRPVAVTACCREVSNHVNTSHGLLNRVRWVLGPGPQPSPKVLRRTYIGRRASGCALQSDDVRVDSASFSTHLLVASLPLIPSPLTANVSKNADKRDSLVSVDPPLKRAWRRLETDNDNDNDTDNGSDDVDADTDGT